MGGSPYWYIVPHEAPQKALDKLREREFKAGRYNPAIRDPDFPVTPQSPAPGAKHRSIAEALTASDADGTRSILDIERISESPEFCSACPLDDEVLMRLYGTTKPTRAAVEEGLDFLDDIERGKAIYMVLFENDAPSEILFAGYSFD